MEQVLVIPEKAIQPAFKWLEEGNGFIKGEAVEFLLSRMFLNTSFMDRDKAEVDPTFKQIIPYICIQNVQGKYLVYRRTKKGGESRLHAKLSIGVGGHINPNDGKGWSAYEQGFWRELEEETYLARPYVKFDASKSIVGMIYDSAADVGRVHLGICHVVKTESEDLQLRDEALEKVGWYSSRQLRETDNLEGWSQIVVSHGGIGEYSF